jgi:hypothetical protein
MGIGAAQRKISRTDEGESADLSSCPETHLSLLD